MIIIKIDGSWSLIGVVKNPVRPSAAWMLGRGLRESMRVKRNGRSRNLDSVRIDKIDVYKTWKDWEFN